jgi:signal transduction histidine kinase
LQALPFVEQVLILGPGGDRRYPGRRARLSAEQRAFLERTHSLWAGKALLHVGGDQREGEPGGGAAGGWLSWHWEQGMELLYWRRDPERGVVAVSIAPVSVLADIIAALPGGDKDPRERIQLRDGLGRVLYQWGGYRPVEQQTPRLSLPLAPPLDSWALVLFFDDRGSRVHGGRLRRLQLVIALVTLTLVSIVLGGWLYRELRRAQREAAERVNFVNQVSHELRTPLTNIRMYAELLEYSVADDPAAEHKLAVIIAESRRLGRLIGNVLSFARQQKKTLRLHRVEASLDELVTDTIEQFRPGLAARGIDIELDCRCPQPFALDPDAVAGILGNLLSNDEKYASGRPLRVATRERGGEALGSPRF